MGDDLAHKSGSSAKLAPNHCSVKEFAVPTKEVKSEAALKAATAWTALENPGLAPPSNSPIPYVVPSNAASSPPAEPPAAPIREGSMLYVEALARSHRTAALAS